jgi:transcriptional regulator with XRE-family HTH domain
MLSNPYGSVLKANRKRLGMTIDEFAQKMEVSRVTQLNYESGKTIPTLAYADKLASIGIAPASLLQSCLAPGDVNIFYENLYSVQLFDIFEKRLHAWTNTTQKVLLFQDLLMLLSSTGSVAGPKLPDLM